jgi:hypothetical protein
MTFDRGELFRDCPWCGLSHAQFHLITDEGEAGRFGAAPRFWTFASCPRSGGVVMMETGGPGNPVPGVLNTYPETASEVQVEHLPPDVDGYHRAAIRVLEAGVPDAAAVELRRTLEAAAAHFEIEERTLVRSVQKLIDAGLITKGFGDVLHHIRQVGNIGAHASDEHVDEETARRALRFTTQVLRNLFEVPAELEALNQPAIVSDEES